jgi:cell division protein FtsB
LKKRRLHTTPGASGRLITPGRVGTVLMIALGVWIASGFASKMVLAYRLNSEVHNLQAQNQQINDQNRAYAQQLAALSKPSGAEEQARLHNYVRPDEKVYVVAQPPSPSPSAGSSPRAATPSQGGGFWSTLWSALTSPFHR